MRPEEMVMNKIVREHYPISKLPEDLREGLDPNGTAVVTVTQSGQAALPSKGLEAVSEYRRTHKPRYQTDKEIVDWVRRIRDGDPL
jgi:hypothetical protein